MTLLDRHECVVSGVYGVSGASYSAEFAAESELARFLEFLFTSKVKPATSRMYMHANTSPLRPEHYVSNLRFQFDPDYQIGAAVLLVIDRASDRMRSWRTVGEAGRTDVVLAHDSWNEHETVFPPEAFVTLSELHTLVMQWAFGETVPPPVVSWADVVGVDWF